MECAKNLRRGTMTRCLRGAKVSKVAYNGILSGGRAPFFLKKKSDFILRRKPPENTPDFRFQICCRILMCQNIGRAPE